MECFGWGVSLGDTGGFGKGVIGVFFENWGVFFKKGGMAEYGNLVGGLRRRVVEVRRGSVGTESVNARCMPA